MINRLAPVLVVLAVTLAVATGASADSPEALARRVEQTLRAGNLDGFRALAQDFDQATALEQAATLGIVADCSTGIVCSASAQPMDPEWVEPLAQDWAAQGLEMPKALGIIDIVGRDPNQTDATKEPYGRRLWHAKVGDMYKLVLPRYTAAKSAELQAVTAHAAATATLAQGIYDSSTGKTDPQWRQKAKPLPVSGGEPGSAFLMHVKATAAAVKVNDVDAAAAALGEWGRRVFAATARDGKPVPLVARQRKLQAEAVRLVIEARVLGGYLLGDQAVLIVEGTNGLGSAVRGAQCMKRANGTWETFDQGLLLEVPKAR